MISVMETMSAKGTRRGEWKDIIYIEIGQQPSMTASICK
jgi:hypothetical protein